MARYIDSDAFMATIKDHHYPLTAHCNSTDYGMFTFGIQQAVDEQVSADVAPVVRCKECVHFRDTEEWNGAKYKACHLNAHVIICKKELDDFCSYGERECVGNEH